MMFPWWTFSHLRSSRGSILLLVLVFLCLLAIWVITFNQGASRTSWLAHRTEQEDLAKRFLEAAVDEAMAILDEKTRDIGHPDTRWLTDRSSTAPRIWTLEQLPLARSSLAHLQREGVLQVQSLEIQLQKRAAEFRTHGPGTGAPEYYGDEGHGVVAILATLRLVRGSQPFLGFVLERHHDYKVACLVSRRQTESLREQAQCRSLDYVLYVKDGLDEFRRTRGHMLNRASFGLQIRPNGKGRIYFGGTSQSGEFVFLNVPPDRPDLLPVSPVTERPLTREETNRLAEQILQLCPQLQEGLKRLNDHEAEAGTSTPKPLLEESLSALQPALRSRFAPISRPPLGATATYVQEALFDDPDVTGNARDNTEPGISILGDGDNPHDLLEGSIRKRFLDIIESPRLAEFTNLLARLPPGYATDSFRATLPDEAYVKLCGKKGEPVSPVVQAIDQTLRSLSPMPLHTPVSRIDDELPWGSNENRDRSAQLRPRTLSEQVVPFQYRNLRSYSVANLSELTSLGVLDGNTLNLHGAVHVRGALVLGERGALTCIGRGIISTGGDIVIRHGITCASGAVLLLATRGRIIIETSEPIMAGIAARTVSVSTGRTLRLKGSLWVETLGSADWPTGDHCIEYDPERFHLDQDLYSVTISTRLLFARMARLET